MELDLSALCRESRLIIEKTGAFILGELGKVEAGHIEAKSLNSLVSYVDRTAEQQLVQGLGALLPGSVFQTEEDTVEQADGEWLWIVDPLDGTTNFLHQIPVFSVSVALSRAGETVMGIVYEINRKECFWGWKGSGVFCNERRVSVSSATLLQDAVIGTGFPYKADNRVQPHITALAHFMKSSRGIRRLGSAATDLAYVACGRFDAFFEYSLNPWDIAAGAFLVQEAGGKVFDFNLGDDYLAQGQVIACNSGLAAEFAPLIHSFFKEH